VAQAYNPRTGNYAQTRQGSGVYGSWGSTQVKRGDDWASTKRFTNSAGNTTRVTRGENGALVNRRGQGFVGKQGDNVYAGRDGNAYRRDANGNWSKWDNGSWNQAQRPNGEARNSMLNENARQRERQQGQRGNVNGGDGVNRTGGNSARTMDRSTYGNLQRDAGARREGSRRTNDFRTYSNRGGNAGSYRGGGYSRGGGGFSRGGGGFRGGGGRR